VWKKVQSTNAPCEEERANRGGVRDSPQGVGEVGIPEHRRKRRKTVLARRGRGGGGGRETNLPGTTFASSPAPSGPVKERVVYEQKADSVYFARVSLRKKSLKYQGLDFLEGAGTLSKANSYRGDSVHFKHFRSVQEKGKLPHEGHMHSEGNVGVKY